MKKTLYFVGMAAVLWSFASCESEPKNPGDFSLKSEFRPGSNIESITSGTLIPLKIARECDTTYKYQYILKDTLKDDKGDPIIGEGGKLTITDDTVYVYSKIKAHFYEMEPVYLPSKADTFRIDIFSNAFWKAANPKFKGAAWYKNYNSTSTGAGDSEFQFVVERKRGSKRTEFANQYFVTSDSTTMYLLPIGQWGEKDEPKD